jgi:8-oxo-dGTP pyrophosphatase MutT (NUDIX family)
MAPLLETPQSRSDFDTYILTLAKSQNASLIGVAELAMTVINSRIHILVNRRLNSGGVLQLTGGKMDSRDGGSAVSTAYRESYEEANVDADERSSLWGSETSYLHPYNGTAILSTTVMSLIPEPKSDYHPNPDSDEDESQKVSVSYWVDLVSLINDLYLNPNNYYFPLVSRLKDPKFLMELVKYIEILIKKKLIEESAGLNARKELESIINSLDV